jgi:hypothetical protein
VYTVTRQVVCLCAFFLSRIIRDVYAHTYDVIDALKVAGVTQNGFK